jgi:HK97 family phage major capsid protein
VSEQELSDQIAALTAEIKKASDAATSDPATNTRGSDALRELAQKAVAYDQMKGAESDAKAKADAREAFDAAVGEAVKAQLRNIKAPSLAQAVGGAPSRDLNREFQLRSTVHPALKALFGSEYDGGTFLNAVAASSSINFAGIEQTQAAKATLDGLGAVWMGVPEQSKATLGTTGATGGYVLPNNLVDSVIKPSTQSAIYQELCNVRTGVNVRGVDQPYRLGAPARAQFQDWGTTKENLSETYGSYTATLGTMARIYDVGKQYLRFSAGSAEADVLDELAKAFALGENYYVIAGSGAGAATPGSGDPTYGVYTALAASASYAGTGGNGYKSTFTGTASNSTIIGSAGRNFATMLSQLAARSRQIGDLTLVVDATTYWQIASQGTDTAGFWLTPSGGPSGFSMSGGKLSFWNVPILYDANLDANTTARTAIAGDWKALKIYRGLEFRVDSSDVAGTRWDQNLVGFRGEEEFAVHAGTAVNTGAFQLGVSFSPSTF